MFLEWQPRSQQPIGKGYEWMTCTKPTSLKETTSHCWNFRTLVPLTFSLQTSTKHWVSIKHIQTSRDEEPPGAQMNQHSMVQRSLRSLHKGAAEGAFGAFENHGTTAREGSPEAISIYLPRRPARA